MRGEIKPHPPAPSPRGEGEMPTVRVKKSPLLGRGDLGVRFVAYFPFGVGAVIDLGGLGLALSVFSTSTSNRSLLK